MLLDATGITSPVVVSPTVREALKLPRDEVPVVDSVPAVAPSTVRCVLPCASPVTVRELLLVIVVVSSAPLRPTKATVCPGST